MSGVANNPYLEASRDDLLRIMTAPNAGAHNAVYRGKCLGGSVTDAQYAAIEEGTFDDLYIGDYWTFGGVDWRIAAFDYFLGTGDDDCIDDHVVIVPDTCLYKSQMYQKGPDNSFFTGGAKNLGYYNSYMRKSNLEQAKTTIKSAFNGHVLKHRIRLTDEVENGRTSDDVWCDSEVDLMCEQMVYGSGIFSPVSDGTLTRGDLVEKSQLPLFQHEPSRIWNDSYWWLRDVITDYYCACISYGGTASLEPITDSNGVRPYFCIY